MKRDIKILLASNNAHKLEEVRAILAPLEVVSLKEIGFDQEIEETGTTLEENSMIKAKSPLKDPLRLPLEGGVRVSESESEGVSERYIVVADDTGLEIAALGGEPGVYTARWGDPLRLPLKGGEDERERGARNREGVAVIGRERRSVGTV